jgi:hypothetical protein
MILIAEDNEIILMEVVMALGIFTIMFVATIVIAASVEALSK